MFNFVKITPVAKIICSLQHFAILSCLQGRGAKHPEQILIKGWYKTMKRIYALALSALMTLSLVACSSAKASNNVTDPNNEPVEISEGMSGGWAHSVNPAVTDEQRDVFNKAWMGWQVSITSL